VDCIARQKSENRIHIRIKSAKNIKKNEFSINRLIRENYKK